MQVETQIKSALNFASIHPSWRPIIERALSALTPGYLANLIEPSDWLPGPDAIFNAFSLPLSETRFILFGESPYPRAASANGYAFWDAAVNDIWSDNGLTKTVNRATSLRNFVKMLLVAEGRLTPDSVRPVDIQAVDKTEFVQTLKQLFTQLLNKGFCLLNASLVLRENRVRQDAKAWLPFMNSVLEQLAEQRCDIQLILLGNIAHTIQRLPAAEKFPQIVAEHPYNISFISNTDIIDFFRPLHLLIQE